MLKNMIVPKNINKPTNIKAKCNALIQANDKRNKIQYLIFFLIKNNREEYKARFTNSNSNDSRRVTLVKIIEDGNKI